VNMTCDVALDLMPLVKDGLASEDSKKLVEEHILQCESCNDIFIQNDNYGLTEINDFKNIKAIKKSIYMVLIGILIISLIFCSTLSLGVDFLLNLYFMPIIGIAGSLIFKKKWYLTPIIVFAVTIITMYFVNKHHSIVYLVPQLSLGYAIVSLFGCLIVLLLRVALKRNSGN